MSKHEEHRCQSNDGKQTCDCHDDGYDDGTRKIIKKSTSKAQNFFNAIKDDPEEIIAWAEREIAEYRKLIMLIKKASRKKI